MEILVDNHHDTEVSDDLMEQIEAVIDTVLDIEDIHQQGEVSLVFVSNEEIKELNETHRDKDSVTDVLSFPQYEGLQEIMEEDCYIALGDIVVSMDRAAEQAEEYGHTLEREVCYLVTHSMYHLLGFDHMDELEKKEMRIREDNVLAELGIERD